MSPTKNLRTNAPTESLPPPIVETGAPTPAAPTPAAPSTLECVDYKSECSKSWATCNINHWRGNCQLKCDNCPQDLPECAGLTDIDAFDKPCTSGDYVPASANYCSQTNSPSHLNNCRKR